MPGDTKNEAAAARTAPQAKTDHWRTIAVATMPITATYCAPATHSSTSSR